MVKKQRIIAEFNPNLPGASTGNIFGLPFDNSQSDIIIIPVPWEVTVSYGDGASEGDKAVLQASFQVDLLHQEFPELWKLGISMDENTPFWRQQSKMLKKLSLPIIQALEEGRNILEIPMARADFHRINQGCNFMTLEVKERAMHWLNQGKMVGLLGGDHSTPLGFFQAHGENHDNFGILHLDAHMDLREAYEDFTYSHASIMFNALEIPQLKKIVQVGIRDFCEEELEVVKNSAGRVKVFTDLDLKRQQFEGESWQQQCQKIIAELPQKVHVSFDIDALYQWYCPNTGTPVPGGLSFEQATYLLTALANSGKEIIGFDLVEVAPGENDEWDGNVGARMLFHLCGALAKSKGRHVGNRVVF
ncbi:MAG: agmatinase family protein [Weeksellaceae bacterium]